MSLCVRGHLLTKETIYVDPSGRKRCRVCQADRMRDGLPCAICSKPLRSTNKTGRCAACRRKREAVARTRHDRLVSPRHFGCEHTETDPHEINRMFLRRLVAFFERRKKHDTARG